MQKCWIAGLTALAVSGCNPITDAGASSPVKIAPPVHAQLNAGDTASKTNNFVGVYGDKTSNHGMQVKFGAEGSVTVDGQTTTAIGTYSAVGNQAEATFQKTNVARFDHVKFELSKDGKTLTFPGPLNTKVSLNRAQ